MRVVFVIQESGETFLGLSGANRIVPLCCWSFVQWISVAPKTSSKSIFKWQLNWCCKCHRFQSCMAGKRVWFWLQQVLSLAASSWESLQAISPELPYWKLRLSVFRRNQNRLDWVAVLEILPWTWSWFVTFELSCEPLVAVTFCCHLVSKSSRQMGELGGALSSDFWIFAFNSMNLPGFGRGFVKNRRQQARGQDTCLCSCDHIFPQVRQRM